MKPLCVLLGSFVLPNNAAIFAFRWIVSVIAWITAANRAEPGVGLLGAIEIPVKMVSDSLFGFGTGICNYFKILDSIRSARPYLESFDN
jgi:hypothetical protein